MTKEFVTKMIAAKRLECEALKELLPDKISDELDQIGAGIKEAAIDWIKEMYRSSFNSPSSTQSPPDTVRPEPASSNPSFASASSPRPLGRNGGTAEKIHKVIIE
ncbi:MAG: hypothetical protein LBV33_02055 [Lachnospiraceae bacterium]|jgi:hypothetical protein|nr:hypothetical protein [Lachnospiraceae bacterium]